MSPNRLWLIAGLALLIALVIVAAAQPATEWEGVDAAVVQRYAADLGREAWTPFVNVQGDLLLFVFAVTMHRLL
ncbi:MAG: hypothetical protein M1370_06895, partial [Bacteroidetes bacterium]|nr:hypothetical protein [Bacteroidota bacterium]